MLDHVSISAGDFTRSKAFYESALAPLGITCLMTVAAGEDSFAGFGRKRPQFWIGGGKAQAPGVHVAFSSPDRKTVDAFHAAALAAGGKDNGAPGLRPHYHADYYGAFVLDPDGNNIEAVCHLP